MNERQVSLDNQTMALPNPFVRHIITHRVMDFRARNPIDVIGCASTMAIDVPSFDCLDSLVARSLIRGERFGCEA